MRKVRVLAVVLILVTAGCATPTPPPQVAGQPTRRGGPIDEELKAASGDPDSMAWSASRVLQLSDFRAAVPPGAVEGARTAYVLSYGMWCRAAVFRFSVSASFLPAQSWVKPRALSDPPEGRRILNHEQTHFNQTEVFARKMRRFFQDQLYNPCGQTEAQLNALADRFVTDEAEAQQRYDDETSFGRIPEQQRVWDKNIHDTLATLAKYAAP